MLYLSQMFFPKTTLYEHLVSISLGSTIPPPNQGGKLLVRDHSLMLWLPTWKFFHTFYRPIFVFHSNPSLIFIALYSFFLIVWLFYLFWDYHNFLCTTYVLCMLSLLKQYLGKVLIWPLYDVLCITSTYHQLSLPSL